MNFNASLETLTEGDAELCNILWATGPGDGIQAPQIVLRHEASIAEYGDYPKAVTFSDALSLTDLQTKGQKYLEDHSGPLESLGIKAVFEEGFNPSIEQGDTVTFASVEAGINVTERIAELSYDDDGVSFSLKAPKADLTGAILGELGEEDRKQRQLGLPPPTAFTVSGARPGVRLTFNPYVGSRAQGVEIHVSLEPNFEPDSGTFVRRTSSTEVHLPEVRGLPLGARWYLKVAAYAGAERGEFTEELSAIAGYVTGDVLDPAIEEALDQIAAEENIAELIEEVGQGQIFVGTVTSFTTESITDAAKNFTARGVGSGWSLKFLSGPLKYKSFTVVSALGSSVTLYPPLSSGLNVTNADYELASNPRLTTLGTTGIVVELAKPPDQAAFSSIKQLSNEIALAVVRDNQQFSLITQLEDEIDIRVVKGDMISAINLDPAGVRISSSRIQLAGDTQVTGNLAITGGASGYGNRVRVLDSGNQEQVGFGSIAGRPWGTGSLPANTWGLHGLKAGIYLRGVPKIVAAGEQQFSVVNQTLDPGEKVRISRSIGFNDVPAFDVLPGEKIISLVYMTLLGTTHDIVGHDVAPQLSTGSGLTTVFVEQSYPATTRVLQAGAQVTVDILNSRSARITDSLTGRLLFQLYTIG